MDSGDVGGAREVWTRARAEMKRLVKIMEATKHDLHVLDDEKCDAYVPSRHVLLYWTNQTMASTSMMAFVGQDPMITGPHGAEALRNGLTFSASARAHLDAIPTLGTRLWFHDAVAETEEVLRFKEEGQVPAFRGVWRAFA